MNFNEARRTLGVSVTATKEEIKKAWRAKALELHPDRGGNESQFKKLNEAYQLLSQNDLAARIAEMEAEIFDTIFGDFSQTIKKKPTKVRKPRNPQQPENKPKMKIRYPKKKT